ncbi:RNA polymerase sigma factor, partial [Dysosmobacter welbionis]
RTGPPAPPTGGCAPDRRRAPPVPPSPPAAGRLRWRKSQRSRQDHSAAESPASPAGAGDSCGPVSPECSCGQALRSVGPGRVPVIGHQQVHHRPVGADAVLLAVALQNRVVHLLAGIRRSPLEGCPVGVIRCQIRQHRVRKAVP